MYQKKTNTSAGHKGFTLVELMIAVAFVGSLLMIVTLITIQIMGLYNKGMTIKGVNEVTNIVVRDVQQSIAATEYFRVQYVDPQDEEKTLYATSLEEASTNNVDYYANAAGGRLCTGVYSYAWNTGAALKAATGTLLNPAVDMLDEYQIQYFKTTNPDNTPGDPIAVRFVKIRDPSKELCRIPSTAANQDQVREYGKFLNMEGREQTQFANAFGAGNQELILYRMHIATPLKPMVNQSQERLTAVSNFYHISMIIGTHQGDEGTADCDEDDRACSDTAGGIVTSSQVCKPPAEAELNASEYCAINRVDFVARTGRIGN